ncbi:type VI secretion system tip protein VgrG [Neolewinella persica]|uniref:type VI secretion system tip protein VgrG n=1 Tax=Neolewinella persica TaxID=70998 RepID=UPI00036E96A1|nr:type VI secretion system tip protein VgrG [Neolewinella persica]
MATSPLVENMEYLSVEIRIEGKPIKDVYDLLSIEVNNRVNGIPAAVFSILLPFGSEENKAFEISEADEFEPGKKVEIKAGYNSKTETIFKGIIIRHGLKSQPQQRANLILHCQDEAVKMTIGRKVKAFTKQTDSAICSSIIGDHSLGKGVAATAYEHPQLLQTGTTDWDFVVTRAEASGMIVYADEGKVFVQKPLASGSPELELIYDRDVFDFDAEIDAGYQLPSVTASGWDFATAKFVEAKSTEPTINKMGNLDSKTLGKVIAAKDVTLPFTGPMKVDELKGISDGILLRSRLAAIRGHVSFFGNAKPKLNTLIELKGFGARFNGEALISSIRHTIREGAWRTETGFGLSPELFHEKHPQPTGSQNFLPSVSGLKNGVVKQIEEDPEGEYRILTSIPVLETDIWARQAGLYATKGKGSFFLPEVGDEVIVGFFNDDPRYAVILGSVYSSRNAPPYTANKENSIKAFVTKNDLKVELNDKDKVLTISTPGKNSFTLSDKDKSITVKDQNGNTLTMDGGGITIKSAKDITIDAGGKLILKAKQNIDAASAGGDVSLKGLNVAGNGQVSATLKGGATAELSAGGQTTVKGAMVMIN